jgi:hypothetical protein
VLAIDATATAHAASHVRDLREHSELRAMAIIDSLLLHMALTGPPS